MKKILITAIMIAMTSGAYAVEFGDITKDTNLKDLVTVQLANTYNAERGTKFASNLRNTQYDGMPSLQAASSKIIYAVNSELERREGLSDEKKAEVETMAYIGKGQAFNMDSAELLSSLEFIDKGALAKISDSLLTADYDKHYQSTAANNNLVFI
ncbi:MAG: hypothetical protein KKD35_04050, partial [Elusimicrobia bacterium]|nr:hypothetical protein [Elusimicrobiota bacterium]